MVIEKTEDIQIFPKCPCHGGLIRIEYQHDIGEYITKGHTELYSIIVTRRHYKFKERAKRAARL